jgi:hypothetical protein
VASGFATLAQQRGWVAIDAAADPQQVAEACQAALLGLAR